MNALPQPPGRSIPVVLSIAGSDSSGGAGIQADLKTFEALQVYGTTALTCVTAQNPREVIAITALDPALIALQIKAVCSALPLAAAKTGMLFSSEIIRAVAAADIQEGIPVLVVDPVMVTASGARLLQPEAIDTLCTELFPQARVITPNLHEAEMLCGHPIESVAAMTAAARELGERYDVACVLKGGHLPGDEVVDVLFDEGEAYTFTARRVAAAETHGAGCAFSAAITALLARGELLHEAVARAKQYVRQALLDAPAAGPHRPLHFKRDEDGPRGEPSGTSGA